MAFIRNGEFKEQNEKEKFFKLVDDKDVKLIRFLHEDILKVPVVTLHTVDIDGYTRKVSCLRTYDEPLSKCPLCATNDKFLSRKYLQLLVYETDNKGNPTGATEVQIWDRGKKFIDKLEGIQRRLEKRGKRLCDVLFDIERIGKKGSTDTTYEPYERTDLDAEQYAYEMPSELYNPIGKSIFDYDFDELNKIVRGEPLQDEGVERRGSATEGAPVENRREESEEEPQEYRRAASRRL